MGTVELGLLDNQLLLRLSQLLFDVFQAGLAGAELGGVGVGCQALAFQVIEIALVLFPLAIPAQPEPGDLAAGVIDPDHQHEANDEQGA